ncbi:MAG: NAD(P)(+) transhydrogenase (Re/Si-specific) subunit beta [Pseudomonadota bacterium]|nr:NAD(P)(+) transhydrogenase (Re/Si-specific) subunit beta [Pseudomonadota bacterium]MEC8797169.1 NAD(P)(+) transhydrogenase (Re/Si-specific) subunit beta [Pseudomonadota bacterium]
MSVDLTASLYLLSGVFFILAIRGLSSPETARIGNYLGMSGMLIAFTVTILNLEDNSLSNLILIVAGISIGGLIGTFLSKKVAMTDMPQMVAALNSMGGMSAVLVAWAAFLSPAAFGLEINGYIATASMVEMLLGIFVGAITFSGSVIAFLKLQGLMKSAPVILPLRHVISIGIFSIILVCSYLILIGSQYDQVLFLVISILSLLLGLLLIIPIGGADMPVVIAVLNSYSGFAAAIIGFTLNNLALVITGALVGSSGAILSYIMCVAMNRSFFSVIMGGFGDEGAGGEQVKETRPVKIGSADDAAFILKNASSVIIVPGYGMAVARAQNSLKEMVDKLKEMGIKVTYAIHPVAGRMPGHMNVLLAEADVPYDDIYELTEINSDFAQADVAFVIGANDVTNPAAKSDPNSPIFGMPILEVENAKTVLFVKRSLGIGYAGIDNDLFYQENTMMLLDDAKKMSEDISASI